MIINETVENYLESIYIISTQKPFVRAIDICEYLGFSRPTISITLKHLKDEGLVKIEANHITLTPEGLKVAKKMYERHETLAQLLMKLGVSKNQAYIDACKVEHDLSVESFRAIKKAYQTWVENDKTDE